MRRSRAEALAKLMSLGLTGEQCLIRLLNMQTITTRDLAHHAARVTELLEAGETVAWTSRGRLIARLIPPAKPAEAGSRDWLARARQAGAINRGKATVSEALYEDRG